MGRGMAIVPRVMSRELALPKEALFVGAAWRVSPCAFVRLHEKEARPTLTFI